MAKKIVRLPGHMSMMLLRLAGAAVTFLFTFFVYASGQIISSGRALAKADSSVVLPAYGVIPLYGVIVEYGLPYAQFSIKGTIRSQADNAIVGNARVVLQDTTTKQIVDSAFTAADGSFFMTFTAGGEILNARPSTWILEVRDTLFQNKDTLISIPLDSLKGGSGFFEGADTVTIELYLQKLSQAVNPAGPGASPASMSMRAWRGVNGTIETRYVLPAEAQTRMALYGATGKLVREFFDRFEPAGEHDARLETSGLSTGTYFLKLQTQSHAAITRISIER